MPRNINKTKLTCKRNMRQNIIVSTMGMLLLGFDMCHKGFDHLHPKDNKYHLSSDIQLLNNQSVSCLSLFSLQEKSTHFLGAVSYVKKDRQLGCIQMDLPKQCGAVGSKKMGLLFYASKDLVDCSAVHLSQQGVRLSYLDGSIEPLHNFMEIDGALLDALTKEAEPLLDRNDHNRLHATCATDFTILTALEYGIQSFNDIDCISIENGIILLEEHLDKTKLENMHHAGFILTASTRNLIECISHLLTNSVQSTSMMGAALVCGNRLQPAASTSGDAAYGYIRNGNRYRLIPLRTCTSPVQGGQYGGAIRQVVESSPSKMPQAVVSVPDGLKNHPKTSSIAVQTDGLHGLKNHLKTSNIAVQTDGLHGGEDKLPDAEWDNSVDLYSSLSYSAYDCGDSDILSGQSDTSSIVSDMFDGEDWHQDFSREQSGYQVDGDDQSQDQDGTYDPEILDGKLTHCAKNASDYIAALYVDTNVHSNQ